MVRAWRAGAAQHERVAKVTRIDVVKDFKELCTLVKRDNEALAPKLKEEEEKLQLSYDEMLDVRLYGFVTERTQAKLNQTSAAARPLPVGYAHHERWLMENESAKGLMRHRGYHEQRSGSASASWWG